ncbi:hypothetical protein [Azorhizobium oxalatiphilum]|nr:hypothetical protein [Azorhizobium oxalatiphilum]
MAKRRTPLGLSYAPPNVPSPARLVPATSGGLDVTLRDLTACDRLGLKGRGASGWLSARGLALPQSNCRAAVSAHVDAVRLGSEDILLLPRSPEHPEGIQQLRADWQVATDVRKGFDALREETWAWFHIGGPDVFHLMSMTCPVDLGLERFLPGRVAQTRVAQMDCIVVRSDRAGGPGFDLFFDVTSSAFMRDSLTVLASAS